MFPLKCELVMMSISMHSVKKPILFLFVKYKCETEVSLSSVHDKIHTHLMKADRLENSSKAGPMGRASSC